MPIIRATTAGPVRKPQAEMPAARATTSSEERDRRQKATMPPSSTAKGRICRAMKGRRSPPIVATMPKLASARVAARRSSSMKSNSETSPVSASSRARTMAVKRRAT